VDGARVEALAGWVVLAHDGFPLRAGGASAARAHVVTGGTVREFLADQVVNLAYPFVQFEHRRRRPLAEIADLGIELVDDCVHLFHAFHAKPFSLFVKFLMIHGISVTFALYRGNSGDVVFSPDAATGW